MNGRVLLGLVVGLGCQPAPVVQAPWQAKPAVRAPSEDGADPDAAPVRSERAREMHRRLESVAAMRDAVVAGEAARAVALGGELQRHLEEVDPVDPERDHVEALINAAELDPASPLPDVAVAVAHLAATCGACHSTLAVKPTFPDEPVPRVDDTLASSMAAHRWATARMWEGLVGPDDDRWRQGTATFAALPRCGALHGERSEEIKALCGATAKLVQRGHVAESVPSRIAIYGHLLGTCAECHAVARSN